MGASSDAWRRSFPSAELLDVVDAVAELVAERVAERVGERGAPAVEKAGFDLREAGEYLGCAASTVKKHVDAGDIKAGRLGTRVLIHRAELDRVLLGQAVAS